MAARPLVAMPCHAMGRTGPSQKPAKNVHRYVIVCFVISSIGTVTSLNGRGGQDGRASASLWLQKAFCRWRARGTYALFPESHLTLESGGRRRG